MALTQSADEELEVIRKIVGSFFDAWTHGGFEDRLIVRTVCQGSTRERDSRNAASARFSDAVSRSG
jgi:hypothetical protein